MLDTTELYHLEHIYAVRAAGALLGSTVVLLFRATGDSIGKILLHGWFSFLLGLVTSNYLREYLSLSATLDNYLLATVISTIGFYFLIRVSLDQTVQKIIKEQLLFVLTKLVKKLGA